MDFEELRPQLRRVQFRKHQGIVRPRDLVLFRDIVDVASEISSSGACWFPEFLSAVFKPRTATRHYDSTTQSYIGPFTRVAYDAHAQEWRIHRVAGGYRSRAQHHAGALLDFKVGGTGHARIGRVLERFKTMTDFSEFAVVTRLGFADLYRECPHIRFDGDRIYLTLLIPAQRVR